MKNLLGLSHRIAYATALALAGFLLAVLPAGLKIDPGGMLTKLLDLPVAAVGLLLPLAWRGIDLWFHPQELGYLAVSDVLIRHLRIAIPVYVLVFYLPTVARGGWRRLRPHPQAMWAVGDGQNQRQDGDCERLTAIEPGDEAAR